MGTTSSKSSASGKAAKAAPAPRPSAEIRRVAEQAGCPIVLLHAHIGSGPTIDEFTANMNKLAHFFSEQVREYPALEAVSFGGGIPHLHVHLAPHRAGDALNDRIIRGEVEEHPLPGGGVEVVSGEFPPLPEEELRRVAQEVESRLRSEDP